MAMRSITTEQSDESLAGRDANGYVDYMGITVWRGIARPLWTDSRSGSEEIFTAAITTVTTSVPTASGDRQNALRVPGIVSRAGPISVAYHVGAGGGTMKLDVYGIS